MNPLAQTAPTQVVDSWLPELVNIGGWGFALTFAIFALWILVTRKVVPGAQYEEMKQDRDLQRERGDKQSERADKAEARSDLALEQGKLLVHLWESLKQTSQGRRDNP